MSDFRKIVGGDLAGFVRRYRRPLMSSAIGAGGGALLGAALPASAGLMGSAAAMGTLGGLGGAAYGFSRDQRKRDQDAEREDLAKQTQQKIDAGVRLDDITDPYQPDPTYTNPNDPIEQPPEDPGMPPGGPQPNPGPELPPQPPVDSITGPVNDPSVTPPMDMPVQPSPLDTTGPIGADIQEIQALANTTKEEQMALLNQQNTSKDEIRRQMAETLNAQMERQFSDQVPGYLEDLNSRGLLRSSALGDRLSKERGRMSAGVNEQLALQGFQDQYGGLQGLSDIQNQYQQSQQGGLSRRFSLEDWQRQMAASKELGQAVTPVTPYSGGGKGGAGDMQVGMSAIGMGKAGMGG